MYVIGFTSRHSKQNISPPKYIYFSKQQCSNALHKITLTAVKWKVVKNMPHESLFREKMCNLFWWFHYIMEATWFRHVLVWLKAIVHPKIKVMSSFTHPYVVPNRYEFCFFCWTQKKIFLKNVGIIKQLTVAIDLHSRKTNTMEVNNCLVTNIIQNVFFCVQLDEAHTGLQQHEGE